MDDLETRIGSGDLRLLGGRHLGVLLLWYGTDLKICDGVDENWRGGGISTLAVTPLQSNAGFGSAGGASKLSIRKVKCRYHKSWTIFGDFGRFSPSSRPPNTARHTTGRKYAWLQQLVEELVRLHDPSCDNMLLDHAGR